MSIAKKGIDFGPPHFKMAVHVVFWLAESGKVISSSLIASEVDSNATFLRRVMQGLASAGIVSSKEGRGGGYFLQKSPSVLTLGDIYQAVIEGKREQIEIKECSKNSEKLDLELETILHEAERNTIHFLHQFTLEEIITRLNSTQK